MDSCSSMGNCLLSHQHCRTVCVEQASFVLAFCLLHEAGALCSLPVSTACGLWTFPELLPPCLACADLAPHTTLHIASQVMMKLKHACNLDARQSMLVESAYFQCNPPLHSALKRKRRPVVHEWIRHLVFVQLGADDVRQVSIMYIHSSAYTCYIAVLSMCSQLSAVLTSPFSL